MKNLFIIFCLSISLSCITACQAQTPITAQRHSELRAALDRNDLAAAEKILREFHNKSSQSFTKNNYD